MFNCIILHSSRKKKKQLPSFFFDKSEVLVKFKIAAILAAILDDVTDPQ